MTILDCASTPEDGANWNPSSIGEFVESSNRRLRETAAFGTVGLTTRRFLERKAVKHGLDTNRGRAYFREANFYREAGPRLQEMFDQQQGQTEQQGPPPKSMAKVHSAAAKFHKRQAEKVGIDTNTGQAHIAAMNHHISQYKQAKAAHKASKQQEPQDEAAFGHSGKQTPMPVPKKSEQPSEDIRQNKPAVPLKKLQQTHGAHAGMMRASAEGSEGGPGSGRHKGGGSTEKYMKSKGWKRDKGGATWTSRSGMTTIPHSMAVRITRNASQSRESNADPNMGTERTLPSRMKDQTDDRVYRGKWPSTHESRRSL